MYEKRGLLNYQPEDANIRKEGIFLVIKSPRAYPKLRFDWNADWFAYHMPNDRLCVKRFNTDPHRAYGELASITFSIVSPG